MQFDKECLTLELSTECAFFILDCAPLLLENQKKKECLLL